MPPFRPRPARSLRPLPRRRPRSTVPWWIAAVLLAGATATTVHGALGRAAAAEAAWRRTRLVVVTTRAVELGERFDGRVVLRRLPQAAVPDGALTALPDHRLATAAIGRGEIVTAARVGGEAAAGMAGALPRGARAVVIPLQVAGLPVQPGDHVDLLASSGSDPADGPATVPSRPVARHALVVVVHDRSLVVAVDPAEALAVAVALGRAPLVPALAAPG